MDEYRGAALEKKNFSQVAPELTALVRITTEYAEENFDQLMELTCTENYAFIIEDEKGSVVLLPYWWHQKSLGIDPREVIERLFEESKTADFAEIVRYMTVVHGYIRLTTPVTAQEIVRELTPLLKEHPHAKWWEPMLGKLDAFWKQDYVSCLVAAAHAGDRKIYLRFSDGQTRLLDMRRLIGRGIDATDLESEERFQFCLSMVTDALKWQPPESDLWTVFFAEDLIPVSELVEDEAVKDIWKADPINTEMLKIRSKHDEKPCGAFGKAE